MCSLPLIYFHADPKTISSVSNRGVDLGLFYVAFAFRDVHRGRDTHAHHLLIFLAINRARMLVLVGGNVGPESQVSYPHHLFFWRCSLFFQQGGLSVFGSMF